MNNNLHQRHPSTNGTNNGSAGVGSFPLDDENKSGHKTPPTLKRTVVVFVLGWIMAFGMGHYFGNLVLLTKGGQDCTMFDGTTTAKQQQHDKLAAVRSKYGPISKIALLGERNSGTSWIVDHLQDCFSNVPTINVTAGLTRYKHWFQSDDATIPKQATIVIGMVRNVYDWSLAMRKRPHHSPLHLHLHWTEFLKKPWTMEHPRAERYLENVSGPICQQSYSYRQIVPCLRAKQKPVNVTTKTLPDNTTALFVEKDTTFSGWDPIYEHRWNGTPYASLLDLRADKIRNYLKIEHWDWIADFQMLQYEQLLRDGTAGLLQRLEEASGIKANCQAIPPAPDRLRNYKHRQNYLEFMATMVDWEAEALVGYSKEGEDNAA